MRKQLLTIATLTLLLSAVVVHSARAQTASELLFLDCSTTSCTLKANPSFVPQQGPPIPSGQPVFIEFRTTAATPNVAPVGSPSSSSLAGDTIFATALDASLLMFPGRGAITQSSFTLAQNTQAVFYFLNGGASNAILTFPAQSSYRVWSVKLIYRDANGVVYEIDVTNPNNPQDVLTVNVPGVGGTTTTVSTTTTTTTTQPPHNAPPVIPVFTSGGGGGIAGRPGIDGGPGNTQVVQNLMGGQPVTNATGRALQNCFPDISTLPQKQQEAICALKGKVIDGKPKADGTRYFDPYAFINRAEAAKMVAFAQIDPQTLEITSQAEAVQKFFDRFYPNAQSSQLSNKPTRFADVPRGQWYAAPVNWLAAENVVSGYGGTKNYGPSNKLQKVELEKIAQIYMGNVVLAADPQNFIVKYLRGFGIKQPWWAKHSGFTTDFLSQTAMMSLLPERPVSRAIFAEYLYELMKLVQSKATEGQ